MIRAVFIAPHPDDETLGCGGTIHSLKSMGAEIHWVIVTAMKKDEGFSDKHIKTREDEIVQISEHYSFDTVNRLNFASAKLNSSNFSALILSLKKVLSELSPTDLYLPFPGDIHSDHKFVFDAGAACSKWFRCNAINRILCYETISETDFGISPLQNKFVPNVFVDIENYIEKKLEACSIYKSEFLPHPFPRSFENVRSLSVSRGATSGLKNAEAFMLIKERIQYQKN
ncbi:PIG-L family deacetylase [Planktomarina temperata]|nr:PIG-L family deacetylase [Planktomarina temperata]